MKIAIRGGHSLNIRGASSKFLDEVNEDRRVKDSVILKLKQLGHDVLDVTPSYSKTSLNDLSYGVNKANNWGANYFASIHFNAGGGIGVECLYFSSSSKAKSYAERISSSIASLGFRNRGAKADVRGLYELRHTKMVANIIEVCFVDTQSDANLYRKLGVDAIANAIVKGITGQSVNSTPSTPKKEVNKVVKYDESIPESNSIFRIPNTNGYIEQAIDGRLIIHKDRGNYIAIGKGFIDCYWNDNNGNNGSKRLSD